MAFETPSAEIDAPPTQESAQETVNVEPVPDLEDDVSPEEVERMRADLIAKARSVQQLMKTLKNNEEQLKEEVQDFLLREVAEHQVTASLVSRVEEQQRRCLADPDYVRWASSNQKGEFSSDFLLPAPVPTTLSPSPLPLQPASQDILISAIPRDVVPELAGWTSNEWSPRTLSFLTELQSRRQSMFTGPMAVLLNGIPLWDHASLLDPSTHRSEQRRNAFHASDGAAAKWRKWVRVVSAVVGSLSLLDVLKGSPSVRDILQAQDENTICVLPFSRVAASVPLRVYAFRGVVAAMETMDRRLNLFRINDLDADDSVRRAVAQVRNALESHEGGGQQARHLAFTVLVDRSSACVIHAQCLSPAIPFWWHYSWSDICGVGRGMLRQDGGEHSAREPELRRTDFDTAEWASYDDATAAWFPLLQRPNPAFNTSTYLLVGTSIAAMLFAAGFARRRVGRQ